MTERQWTAAEIDRLRWACLGAPSIQRMDAMQRLAIDMNVPYKHLYGVARAVGAIGGRRDAPARQSA